MTLNLEGSLQIVCPQQSLSDFNEIWYVDRAGWLTHDVMLYDPIQGQGHECLQATQQEESTISLALD